MSNTSNLTPEYLRQSAGTKYSHRVLEYFFSKYNTGQVLLHNYSQWIKPLKIQVFLNNIITHIFQRKTTISHFMTQSNKSIKNQTNNIKKKAWGCTPLKVLRCHSVIVLEGLCENYSQISEIQSIELVKLFAGTDHTIKH